jgi:hypothetical protein
MKNEKLINDIVFLIEIFSHYKDVSMYTLVKQTGFFESLDEIIESDIYEELIKYPDCINHWMQYSEDQRTDSGWYILKAENGKYIVGYFPAKANIKKTEYTNITEACASYIKHYMDNFRKIFKNG